MNSLRFTANRREFFMGRLTLWRRRWRRRWRRGARRFCFAQPAHFRYDLCCGNMGRKRISLSTHRTVERLERRALLAAQFVSDINTGTLNSDPSPGVDVEGTLFFTARAASGDVALFKTDRTTQRAV